MSSRTILIRRFGVILILICLLLSYIAQINYDSVVENAPSSIKTSYNVYIEPQPPSAEVAKIVSFGQTELLADWYWLALIQYLGGGEPYSKYRKLAELFNLVTELSPKYLAAYQTGLLVLPGEGFANEAIALGKKGERQLSDSWEIPYYTGMVYHIYKKDYLSAAHEFDLAAKIPGAPENTKYLSALYYNQADQRQIAYQIFKNVYETTSNDYFKDRAEKQIKTLDIIFFLEDTAKIYKQKYGNFPNTLNDLVEKKIIKEVPENPLQRILIIDPKTGIVSEDQKV